MINRRPKKGEALERMTNWNEHLYGAEPKWEPLGVVHRCKKNLCWFVRHGQSHPGLRDVFVWRFPDAHNRTHRIVEKT
ncbi:MAG: hypothetical protein ACYSVY_15750 [Planctomycetota bacterium]|jgi:hypothetical protein